MMRAIDYLNQHDIVCDNITSIWWLHHDDDKRKTKKW